jgi:carbon-monoxide dehydrogenase medium subunit
MYPRPFEYYRANSVQEAIQLLQQHEDSKILSGGHSLLPAMKLRLASPAALIDISRVQELKNMSNNGGVTIGAGVTYNDFLNNSAMQAAAPALYEAASKVGDLQVRNLGTIGGAAAHADPASDVPAALMALNATLTVVGPNGSRDISADDFFVDILTTALEPDEVLTSIKLPVAGVKSAYEKFAHPASGYAVVGVAAALGADGPRVAITGSTYKATRATGVEDALKGGSMDAAAIEAAAEKAADGLELAGDHYASAEYRAHLTKVFAKRALLRAAGVSS